jgi:hypothetical protein
MQEELKEKTELLLSYVQVGKEQYETRKSSGQEGDFFQEVKPFADKVKNAYEDWYKLASKWVLEERPTFINDKQLQNTCEHLENISIQSFFPKASKKRYISAVQSAEFVLESILNNVHNSKKKV